VNKVQASSLEIEPM